MTSIGEQKSGNGCAPSSRLITSLWVRLRRISLERESIVDHRSQTGIQADDLSELITIDQDYLDRMTARRSIVANYKNTVHGCLPGGEAAVMELYSYLVGYHLPTRFPSMFKITEKGSFQNIVTGARFPLSPPSDPEICLRTLAETVDEDIFLLKETDTTHVCLAFLCCFPTGFDPSTKLGQDLKRIHDPVPSYDKIGPSMERFFRKLQVGKSVKRMNVSIVMVAT